MELVKLLLTVECVIIMYMYLKFKIIIQLCAHLLVDQYFVIKEKTSVQLTIDFINSRSYY